MVAIFMQSRGWLLQCALAIAIRWVIISPQAGRIPAFIRVCGSVAGLAIVAAIGIWFVSSMLGEPAERLAHRATEDSRSGQYREYFANVELWRLVLGYGPDGTYTYDRDGERYGFIDNQFLYIALKYGLVTAAAYVALALWPGVRVALGRIPIQQKAAGFVIILWCLSHAGLSVFCGVGFDAGLYLAFLLGGKCRALLSAQPRRPESRSAVSERGRGSARWSNLMRPPVSHGRA
jgi:hypothetical protein